MSIYIFENLEYRSIILDICYNTYMEIFAERLKYLREKKGLMQKVVAKDLFISNTTLSNYEQNVCSPNPELIVRIAKYFHTSCDYLLGMTDNPDPIGSTEVNITALVLNNQVAIANAIGKILTDNRV